MKGGGNEEGTSGLGVEEIPGEGATSSAFPCPTDIRGKIFWVALAGAVEIRAGLRSNTNEKLLHQPDTWIKFVYLPRN